MIPSIQARLLAKVFGNSAVIVASLFAFAFVCYLPLEWPLKALAFIIIGVPIVTGGIRLFYRGEQGTTDLELTRDRLIITNIPLGNAQSVLSQSLTIYQRQPLPDPAGIVKGNPAHSENVIELTTVGPPDQTENASKDLAIPEGAEAIGGIVENRVDTAKR